MHLADLSSQRDVRRVAAELLAAIPGIDVLVNNAGVVNLRRALTVDGIEAVFATNHLAYFLLTLLLLDRLRASAPARIVNVASEAHRFGRLDFDDLGNARRYRAMRVYGQSKLANILFTYELARRLARQRGHRELPPSGRGRDPPRAQQRHASRACWPARCAPSSARPPQGADDLDLARLVARASRA